MLELEVASREDWRGWLREHHATGREVWLVFHKGPTAGPLTYEATVEEALCFGWVDSLIRRLDDQRYARKYTPRQPGSAWSKLNKARAEKMIGVGLMTPAGQALIDQAKASGEWDTARERVTFAVAETPPELAAALAEDAAARATYDSLPASARKQYHLWIVTAQRPETRQRRVATALEKLRRGERLGLK